MDNKELMTAFFEVYGEQPQVVASAPGRLEILGNHTDYNEGVVLSCAVEQRTKIALRPMPGKCCRVFDLTYQDKAEFSLDEIDNPRPGEWINYVKGVVAGLKKRGFNPGAFDAVLHSTVPLSAGMSSSAALETAVGLALGEAFSIKLDKTTWAKVGQGVENDYLGVNTGLLDQFSSIYGCRNALILSDFRINGVVKTVAVPAGYRLVVVNSMEKHNLVDSEYNVRRLNCENAVAKLQQKNPEIKALRDVTMSQLDAAEKALSVLEYRRVKHIVGENERVLQGVVFLEKGDVAAFGKLLFESHASSRRNFENSTPRLDYLVELAASLPGCLGARLSGGGFGGISIHLVEDAAAATYAERVATAFKLHTGTAPQVIHCAIGDGATVERVSVK